LLGDQHPYAKAGFAIRGVKLIDSLFDDARRPSTIPGSTRTSVDRGSLSFGYMHAWPALVAIGDHRDLIPAPRLSRFENGGGSLAYHVALLVPLGPFPEFGPCNRICRGIQRGLSVRAND
jgi:hypothetical protein